MKKTLLTIFFILVSLFLFGCGTGRITTLDREENEAIIIANVQIINGNKSLDNKWNFLLDERLVGNLSVWPDEQNYIYMKVPIGKHFISLLQYYPYSRTLPDNYLSINIKENKIYYIGDIKFYWNIDENNDRIAGGLLGAISDSEKDGDSIKVEINDNYDNTVKYFNAKFLNNQNIEKELLLINK
mgnify:CR=1 FL=1